MVTQTIQWTRQRALHKHGILLRFAGALAKTVSAGMCVASAAGFYPVAKWNRMYQVLMQ
jgi:hypothetical protein